MIRSSVLLVACTLAFAGEAAAQHVIGGCALFPANNIWNTPVDTLPLSSDSTAIIDTIGPTRGFHADFGSGLWDGGPIGIPFITVPGSQPKYPATFDYDDESDPGPYAIPLNAPIEGGSASDGDRHVLSLETTNCILYELYYAFPQADSWKASAGAIFDLKSNALRPDGWTSTDAAGLPVLAGLVTYDEILTGEIKHAIRLTVPRTRNTYVWPARHAASSLTGSQYPRMGERLRLKANFDVSSYPPEVQIILRAMKKYGLMVADNGSAWYITGAPDERWNNENLAQLGRVLGSNLEVVDATVLMVDEDSGATRPWAGSGGTTGGGDFNGDGAVDLVWRNSRDGSNAVWFMNGTSMAGQGSFLGVTDLAWQLVAVADVNLDGRPDLIWRHQTTGANAVWYMNGTTRTGAAELPAVPDLAWQLCGSGDFNGDGSPDLVWRNLVTGANVLWYMNGVSIAGSATLLTVPDLAWQLVATADLNRDGKPDLVWRHAATGANAIWYMNGATLASQATLQTVPDLAWRLMAALDLDADGMPELIWRHGITGWNVAWSLNGASVTGQSTLPAVADPTWKMAGAIPPEVPGDINLDRHPDLVWRNPATGENAIWYLNGPSFLTQTGLPAVAGAPWQRVAMADFNGDTHPDLVWRNSVTGANVVWYLDASGLLSQDAFTSVLDTTWRIVAAADINHDTYPDLIWRNTATGDNAIWYMHGTTLLGQAGLPSVPDTAWTIAGAADFNGDTYADLVWRNTTTGANVVWYLAGQTLVSQGAFNTVPDLTWRISAVVDVNGDGHPDLVWRNTANGANLVWYLSGTGYLGQDNLPAVSDINWILQP